MKIKLPNHKSVDLSLTKVMGTIALSSADDRSTEELVALAKSFVDAGAEFLEVGTMVYSSDVDESRVSTVLEALVKELDVPVAVNSNNPNVIINALKLGASMVITSVGLDNPEAMTAFKNSGATVCLHCEPHEYIDDDTDIVSSISEFFFVKIDGLLNNGIDRRRILIDPSIIDASVSSKLHLIGRLESFKSFALPICVGIPRHLPQEDYMLKDNRVLTLTAAVFCASGNSVQIIRTSDVNDVAIAIGFWQIMSAKTKPYGLSKMIVRRLRKLRDAVRTFKEKRIKKKTTE